MENRHNLNANTASHSHARVHWFIAILGIMTAVISTLVLLQDVNDMQRMEARESRRMESSKFGINALTAKVKTLSDVSVIWVHK